MQHDVLGTVTPDPLHPEDASARVSFESREIGVQMIADDQPLAATVDLAAKVVRNLAELDAGAKRVIASDLWARYGSSSGAMDIASGGFPASMPDPAEMAAAFTGKMFLATISVTGGSTVELYYDDAGLFDGRAVIVVLRDGIDLSSARAELFG